MVKPRIERPASQTGLSLNEMAIQMTEWTGEAVPLVAEVIRYRRGRDMQAALSDPVRREAVDRACVAAMMRSVTNDGRWRIDRSATDDRVERRLTSEAVRRLSPDLWAVSKETTWRLGISGTLATPVRVIPVRSATVNDLIAVMRQDATQAKSATKDADSARRALINVFDAVTQVSVWSGEPLASTDGWTIGYQKIERFSRTVCRQRAEDASIDTELMMTEVTVRGGVRWRVVDLHEDTESDAEGDQYAP